MIKIKDSLLTHLIISASPGGYKIFLLAAVGYLGSSTTQGEIANELAITSFLSLLTSIGIGILLLHIVPKKTSQENHANSIFKGVLIKSTPHILSICIALLIINYTVKKINAEPALTAALLFTTSIYWLFRHLQIARKDIEQAVKTEAAIWCSTTIGLIASAYLFEITTKSALIITTTSYLIAITPQTLRLCHSKAEFKTTFYRQSILISISNLSSGGLMFLAPSIAFHFGGVATAGIVGIMTNSLAISLAGIRAYLNKTIPNISELISQKNHAASKFLTIKHQATINRFLLISSMAALPTLYLISFHSQPTTNPIDILKLSILVTAFCYTPQLTAINSIIANYYNKSSQILLINTLHATSVIAMTTISELTNFAPTKTTEIFLLSSTVLYILRNIFINKVCGTSSDHKYQPEKHQPTL